MSIVFSAPPNVRSRTLRSPTSKLPQTRVCACVRALRQRATARLRVRPHLLLAPSSSTPGIPFPSLPGDGQAASERPGCPRGGGWQSGRGQRQEQPTHTCPGREGPLCRPLARIQTHLAGRGPSPPLAHGARAPRPPPLASLLAFAALSRSRARSLAQPAPACRPASACLFSILAASAPLAGCIRPLSPLPSSPAPDDDVKLKPGRGGGGGSSEEGAHVVAAARRRLPLGDSG